MARDVAGHAVEADYADYRRHDLARLYPEGEKQAALLGTAESRRSPFARDRARVLHSAALRRLAGKTQVVGPDEGDVPRTRLTHSLEVAQIGRGIATELGCDPDIVDTAGLAHDIGHPPFGHNGEAALDEVAKACDGFEANAQTLRILTRIEPKVLDDDGRHYGLNLTRAALDATIKYPWQRLPDRAKFGVYGDDLRVFEWVRDGAPGERRCLESQVMDWADDVAYSVHDVEDGIVAGRLRLGALADAGERATVARLAVDHFCDQQPSALEAAAAGLLDVPVVAALRDYDWSLAAQVALKTLTSELVGRFIGAAVAATQARYGTAPLCRYDAELVVPERAAAEVAVLKALALRYVMSDERRLAVQGEQRELLVELCDALRERSPDALDPGMRQAWQSATDDRERTRVVVDQVASLTDAQAVRWHRALTGRASRAW